MTNVGLHRVSIIALAVGIVTTGGARCQPAPPQGPRQKMAMRFAGPLANVRILRTGAPAGVAPTSQNVVVKPGELAVHKLEAAPLHEGGTPDGQGAVALPYEIKGLDVAGQEVELHPDIEITGGGMRPISPTGPFRGLVSLGVHDAKRQGPHKLTPPIAMEIVGDVETITPSRVELTETNRFVSVTLIAHDPPNPVNLKIVPTFDAAGTVVPISVKPARILVEVSPSEIQGLGLETAVVTIQTAAFTEPKDAVVPVHSSIGSLDETNLRLDEHGFATTMIRSVSIGPATLTAQGPMVATETPGKVTFRFPWLFLASCGAGSIVGTLFRLFAGSRSSQRGWVRRLARGLCAGLIAAAAYAIGINLLGIHPAAKAGEALVFVVSALGAISLVSALKEQFSFGAGKQAAQTLE